MKGDSAAIKTDWDTGLGRLLDTMNDDKADYAMAVREKLWKIGKKISKICKGETPDNLLYRQRRWKGC
ncbi:MAG: hypothetical protein ACE5HG_01560 [Candidatus Bathyarchaeia archaeon]